MPFHLTPFTRRRFLKRSIFGGVAIFTLRRSALAEGVDPDFWALLSDPHIPQSPDIAKGEIKMAQRLASVIGQIADLERKPAGLILNGDCAYIDGDPAEYAQFLGLMKGVGDLKIPAHLTLGNHDHRENFWRALQQEAALPRPVAGKQVSIIETPAANWFLLDSLEITKQTAGRLGAEQLSWLTQELDARAAKPALIVVHHPPVHAADQTPSIADADAFMAIVLPRRHVKTVFFGHTHAWSLSSQEGLHLVNLPAVGYPFKETEPTGWVKCWLKPERIALELRAHDSAHPAHGKLTELSWRA